MTSVKTNIINGVNLHHHLKCLKHENSLMLENFAHHRVIYLLVRFLLDSLQPKIRAQKLQLHNMADINELTLVLWTVKSIAGVCTASDWFDKISIP